MHNHSRGHSQVDKPIIIVLLIRRVLCEEKKTCHTQVGTRDELIKCKINLKKPYHFVTII